jgi:hypothetical protein
MHAKLQCWMGWWPYELKEYTKHTKHQRTYEIWWYEWGCDKPKWKEFNDIYKYDPCPSGTRVELCNVANITTFITHDCV